MNRTIQETIISILKHSVLVDVFWAEALLIKCTWTCCRVEISTWRSCNSFGHDKCSNYDKLRIFECEAFALVPKDKIGKLESRSQKCIFLGYVSDCNYGYQLRNLKARQIVQSWDVVFNELTMHKPAKCLIELRRVIFIDPQLLLMANLTHSINYSESSWSCTSDPPYKSISSPLQKRSSAMIWCTTGSYHTDLTDCLIH